MKFCVNCDQNTQPRRDMSGAKKIISIISFLMLFFLGIMMLLAGMHERDFDGAIGGFVFFTFIGLLVSLVIYYMTSEVCPICKIKPRKSPLLDKSIKDV